MPQSLVQIYVHIVFSTKHRSPFLNDAEFRDPGLCCFIPSGWTELRQPLWNFDYSRPSVSHARLNRATATLS